VEDRHRHPHLITLMTGTRLDQAIDLPRPKDSRK